MKKIVQRLLELFRGHSAASGTHGVPERDPDGLKWNIKRTARTVRVPVTDKLWTEHLEGKRPLGVIPIREDNSCSWGSIDYDQYDVDLLELVREVEKTRLPLVPCRSKSGGLHLFLFLSAPASAGEVQGALRDVAASIGMAECEIFPKQTRLLDERDVGNWMVMPYFGGDFGGKLRMQHGLKRTGAEMTVGEFLTYAESKRVSLEEFLKLIDKRKVPVQTTKAKSGKRKVGQSSDGKGDFSDGPPCLQHLCAGNVQRDGRKRTLFMMALYHRRSNEQNWKSLLEESNARYFSPPLPAEEVAGVVRSVEKKEYEYTCKEEPMRSHCNSALCRTRRFGVGRGGEFPVISGMAKLETEPPIWFVDVEGERLEISTDELQMYYKFHKACMDRVSKCYKMMSQSQWLALVSEAMQHMVPIQATPDMGVSGRFLEYLEEFLTNRAKGERREDLLSGRPWEDPETRRHYFTLRSLQRYLGQEGFKELGRVQIVRRIEQMGGGYKFQNFDNKRGLSTWWVPAGKVSETPEIPVPPRKGGEI